MDSLWSISEVITKTGINAWRTQGFKVATHLHRGWRAQRRQIHHASAACLPSLLLTYLILKTFLKYSHISQILVVNYPQNHGNDSDILPGRRLSRCVSLACAKLPQEHSTCQSLHTSGRSVRILQGNAGRLLVIECRFCNQWLVAWRGRPLLMYRILSSARGNIWTSMSRHYEIFCETNCKWIILIVRCIEARFPLECESSYYQSFVQLGFSSVRSLDTFAATS